MTVRERFWERYPLEALSEQEWEALCDGCARCCLLKLEDEDNGDLYFTELACRCLNLENGRCVAYAERLQQVPDCLRITPAMARDGRWLPPTCAYRRLGAGLPLPEWHPLLSGDPASVEQAGISVLGRVIPEVAVSEDDWEDHIIHWVE